MIARLHDIVKRYGTQFALDHLHIEVNPGEVFGLLGPNGAGKTTCIRVMTGLTAPDSGEVALFSEPLRGQANHLKKRIGVVPQDIAVYEMLTARENLNYFGSLYGLHGARLKESVDRTLRAVGLSDVGKKLPKKFSGGMKRRLNIGCAIVHQPELLIMDEPTVGIDPQSRNHILSFVQDYAREGGTVIYTSHYMEEVARLCSRVAIMDEGKVIASGSVEELTRSVAFDERVQLQVERGHSELAEALRKVGGVRSCEETEGQLLIISEPGSANIAKVLEIAHPYTIVSVVSERPTLEDVFLTLTGKRLRDEGEEA